MKMNKKGFTLIELLAVITILGIVMLIAVVAVLPMINKSQLKALSDEGKSLVKAAQLAYADKESTMRGKNICLSMEWLKYNNYYEKGWEDGYVGSVYIINNGQTLSYVIGNEAGSYGYGVTNTLNNMISKSATDPALSDGKKSASKNDEINTRMSHCNTYNSTANAVKGNNTYDNGEQYNSIYFYHHAY